MSKGKTIGSRLMPPRFLLFLAVLAGSWLAAIPILGGERGLLSGFDLAAATFLLSCMRLFRLDPPAMRRTSADNDANRPLLLAIAIALVLVNFAATTSLLGQHGELPLFDKLLVAGTLVMVWLFANAVYAMHYAHLYYLAGSGSDCAGLEFPGREPPDFSDFVYFAFTIGVAVQTADVQITSRTIRRVVTVHSVVGFFFNLGVLALTVNVLASG